MLATLWESVGIQFNEQLTRLGKWEEHVRKVQKLFPLIHTPAACKLVQPALQQLLVGLQGLSKSFPPTPARNKPNGRPDKAFAVPESLWTAWVQAMGTDSARPVSFPQFSAALQDFLRTRTPAFDQLTKFDLLMKEEWLPFASQGLISKRQSLSRNLKDVDQRALWDEYSGIMNLPMRANSTLVELGKSGTKLTARLRAESGPDDDAARAVDQWILEVEPLQGVVKAFIKSWDDKRACLEDKEVQLSQIGLACKTQVLFARCQAPLPSLSAEELRVICPAVIDLAKEKWNEPAVLGGASAKRRAGPRTPRRISTKLAAYARTNTGRPKAKAKATARRKSRAAKGPALTAGARTRFMRGASTNTTRTKAASRTSVQRRRCASTPRTAK